MMGQAGTRLARRSRWVLAAVCCAVLCPAASALDEGRDGPYLEKYGNDIHKLEAFYRKGIRDGRWQEFWETGRVKLRCSYKDDKLTGLYQEFNEEGKVAMQCGYVDGIKEGTYTEYFASGKPKLQCVYVGGLLHGMYRAYTADGQVEKEITYIYGGDNRFPRKAAEITRELETIAADTARMDVTPVAADPAALKAAAQPAAEGGGDRSGGRRGSGNRGGGQSGGAAAAAGADAGALRQTLTKLKQARAIAGVPYTDITFKQEYLVEAQAAAELLAELGHLDHHPAKPAGMTDERFQLGLSGCDHGNLAMGQRSLVEAQVTWLYDSDDVNKFMVGHRRWSLNPAMLQVGYGQAGKFYVMWAHDGQRAQVPDFTTISWPAAGYHPVGFFGSNWCWHVSLNPEKFQEPSEKTVKVRMWALGRDYTKQGAPLELNHFCVNTDPYGVRYAVIWRPKTNDVAPGKAYYVEIEGLKDRNGQPVAYNQVTEFVP